MSAGAVHRGGSRDNEIQLTDRTDQGDWYECGFSTQRWITSISRVRVRTARTVFLCLIHRILQGLLES